MKFSNTLVYSKGIGTGEFRDPGTGAILTVSDKFTEGQIQFTANLDPLRAGWGNPITAIISTDSDVQVNFTRADTDLLVKMMSIGGKTEYNAIVPVCQTIKATTTKLTLDVTKATPAAMYGYDNIFGYVQVVGEKSTYETGGVPYTIDPASGDVQGFTATVGKEYLVTFFAKRLDAKVGVVGSSFDGSIVHFSVKFPLYKNLTGSGGGTLWGWRNYILPRLKLSPEGAGSTGGQNSYDTTAIVGRAIHESSDVVTADCNDCGTNTGGVTCYIVDIPCEESDEVDGIVVVGGTFSLPVSTSAQLPVQLAMKNGDLVTPSPYSLCKYTMNAGTAEGTTIDKNGVITAGATEGTDATIDIAYPAEGTPKYTAKVFLEVEAAGP